MVGSSLGKLLRSAAAAADAKRRHGKFDNQMAACLWLEMQGVDVDTGMAIDLMIAGEAEGVGRWGETYTATIKQR
jgi:hypothetical protein